MNTEFTAGQIKRDLFKNILQKNNEPNFYVFFSLFSGPKILFYYKFYPVA